VRCPAPTAAHSIYQAYWYEIIWGSQISADTVVRNFGMPYFDIEEFGKDIAARFGKIGPAMLRSLRELHLCQRYASANGLERSDYGILKAGDGRANKVVAMKRFHNELIAWQEELGVEGGCVTLFEGYSPATFAKL